MPREALAGLPLIGLLITPAKHTEEKYVITGIYRVAQKSKLYTLLDISMN